MLCKIAGLLVEVPETGNMSERCRGYLWEENVTADITLRSDLYRPHLYPPKTSAEMVAYMESASQFYVKLLEHNGLYLHASAVVRDGKAYLFSAHSGGGKSTHTRLWQATFGGDTRVINDDKPALRRLDRKWYAYGTPWCGKDGININEKAPLAGICFLKKAQENKIRRLSHKESLERILAQTIRGFSKAESLDVMLGHLNLLLKEIPVFELENLPEPAAAYLSYETMRQGAEELKL